MECILEQRSTYERFRDYAEKRLLHSLKKMVKHFNNNNNILKYNFKYQQYLLQLYYYKNQLNFHC